MAETQAPPDDLVAETQIVNAYSRLLFLRTRRAPGMWQPEDVQRLDELRATVRSLFAGIAQIEHIASGADEPRRQDDGSTNFAELERALGGGQQPQA